MPLTRSTGLDTMTLRLLFSHGHGERHVYRHQWRHVYRHQWIHFLSTSETCVSTCRAQKHSDAITAKEEQLSELKALKEEVEKASEDETKRLALLSEQATLQYFFRSGVDQIASENSRLGWCGAEGRWRHCRRSAR